jgi:hypothetical protein
MQKATLATALRQRQYAHGEVPRALIDAMSDDKMLWSYTTCSCCGTPTVTPEQLTLCIWQATDADHFFDLCDQCATHTRNSL